MIAAVQEHIAEYGGKNGVLKYLHDYHPEMREHLVPTRILKNKESVSPELFRTLKDVINQYNTYNILNRRSHPDDRYGMVDHLPTDSIPLHFIDELACLNKKIKNDDIRKHKVGNTVRKEMTFNLTPLIGHTLYTVTENPNRTDSMYIDTGVIDSVFEDPCKLIGNTVIENSTSNNIQNEPTVASIVALVNKIRGLGLFDLEERLQYEIGITRNDKRYLFQIRQFCELFPPFPKDIQNALDQQDMIRLMGQLPPSGIKIPHIQGKSLIDINDLAQSQTKDFIFTAEHVGAGHSNTRNPQTPYFKGFLSGYHRGLYHNLTMPSQLALKNRGFVGLAAAKLGWDDGDTLSIDHKTLAKDIAKIKEFFKSFR
ncbi:MAG: hypothetical protein WC004_02345 [Candidatus Absconditabacterales bacterium]